MTLQTLSAETTPQAGISETAVEEQRIARDLSVLCRYSPYIFIAACTGETDGNGYTKARLVSAVRGNVEEELYLKSPHALLSEGTNYLIFASKRGNVMLDLVFFLVIDYIQPVGDAVRSSGVEDLEGLSFKRILESLTELVSVIPCQYSAEITSDYIHSYNREEIQAFSPFTARLTALEITNTLSDRMWCECRITEMIKGTLPKDTVTIVLPLGSVETGQEYVISFRPVGESDDSNYYIISAPAGIYPSP